MVTLLLVAVEEAEREVPGIKQVNNTTIEILAWERLGTGSGLVCSRKFNLKGECCRYIIAVFLTRICCALLEKY